MKKTIVIALCVVCAISCLVGLVACVDIASNVTASAEEEVASNVVYTNYELSLNHAPLHFYIPYENYQTLSPSINSYFTEGILTYSQDSSTGQYLGSMFFVFQVVDNVGNVYYENIGKAGNSFNLEIDTNGQYLANSNNYSSAFWSGSVQSLYQLTQGGRVFYPVYTTSTTYPFKVYFSSADVVDISSMRVRSCALHDLQVYGSNDDRIWVTYDFVNVSSNNYRDLRIIGVSETHTDVPTYPIKQSSDAIYNLGYNTGYNSGYNEAFNTGYNSGYNTGYTEGNSTGYNNGYTNGESAGYNQGVLESNDYSFLSLTSAVFDAPVTILTEMLDFEILGFNMRTLVLSLLSLALVFGLIKLFI